MFGYVLPLKPELKVREWQEYRAYYCGLCKELKREYGFISRFFLNYDLVLLALLADGLQNGICAKRAERCIANPLQKRCVCAHSAGLALAADALILSCYYKVVDDLADERFFKRVPSLLAMPLLRGMQQKAEERRPKMDKVLREQTVAQSALEAQKNRSVDQAAEPTAQMTAELFAAAAPGPREEKILRRLGLFAGKIIYYLDAAEDYEKDKKNSAYNVFLLQGLSREETIAQTQLLCRMCAGEIGLCYNLLTISTNRELLNNIFFLGLPQSIALAGQPRHRDGSNTTLESV